MVLVHDADDISLLCALTDNVLAAQRGRPYPGLDNILRQDPTVGVPPDVRRALLLVAQQCNPDVMPTTMDDDIGEGRHFVRCDFGPKLPSLEPDPFPERDQGGAASHGDIERFFKEHKLTAPQDEMKDEHYAERRFIEQVVAPVLGKEGLWRIRPQEPFVDLNGRQRRIDFVLRGEQRYALEVEGATYHAAPNLTRAAFVDEKTRQRALGTRGFIYQGFAWDEILDGSATEAFQKLCEHDRQLAQLILRERGGSGQPSLSVTDLITRKLLAWAPERFVQVQRALLPMLNTWLVENRREVQILNLNAKIGILNLALAELLACASHIAQLFGLRIAFPHITIHTRIAVLPGAQTNLVQPVLDAFHDGRISHIGKPDYVSHLLDETATPHLVDAIFCVETPRNAPKELNGSPVHSLVKQPNIEYPVHLVQQALARLQSSQLDAEPLNYFARRLFSIPSLKSEQISVIQRLLSGSSQLAILPTAFGKSLCYQLPGVLIPGVIFVISPLRALMRDQMYGLEAKGLTCASAIMHEDSKSDKEQKVRWLAQRRFRVFYLAPERLQVKSFAEQIQKGIGNSAEAWALAVDEAHCASEWGHDFRVAYLQLGRFRRVLAHGRQHIPAIALTATASETVAHDICSILDIADEDEKHVVRMGGLDRSEISLSVHEAVDASSKSDVLRDLFERTLPGILDKESLLPSGPESAKNLASIIFAPYTDAHGRATADQNCASIMRNLIREGVVDEQQIRTYSGKQPRVCPKCKSPNCIYVNRENLYHCQACDSRFPKLEPMVGKPQEYEDYTREAQAAFSRNSFPILVATKGFGMGIDKRNIRVIAHYALADGLEAYVQETGRAARDGHHAHAALIYSGPTLECLGHLRSGVNEMPVEPKCVSDDNNFVWHNCPHGLKHLCDYGLKARNIRESYGSVRDEVVRVMRTYDALVPKLALDPGPNPVNPPALFPRDLFGSDKVNNGEERDGQSDQTLKRLEYALYRLQEIGIVRDWFIDFENAKGGLANPPVTVRSHRNWTVALGIANTRMQLRKLVQSNHEQEYESIERAIGLAVHDIAADDSRSQVQRLTTLVVDRTHREVKAMRLYMLNAELTYAKADAKDGGKKACRRDVLRRAFDSRVSAETQDCGTCDVCRPDLKFNREIANPVDPTDAEALEEVTLRLPDAFAAFSREETTELVNIAAQHRGLLSLQGQAEQHLTTDPFNLSALAIAGLCARYQDVTDQAIYHFSSGFGAVERGFRDAAAAIFFYEHIRELDAPRALSLLKQHGGVFDTPEGHAYALKELERAVEQGVTDVSTVDMARWLHFADEWDQQVGSPLHEAQAAITSATKALNQASGEVRVTAKE